MYINSVFVQARLKSTRLNKKVLIKLNGRPIIDYLVSRIQKNTSYPVILLTSTNKKDNPLIEYAKQKGIAYFAGSENDVIDRFYRACIEFKVKKFYLLYGDEPNVDIPTIINNFSILSQKKDVIIFNHGLPEGTYRYGFSLKSAEILNNNKTSYNNEVWGQMAKRIGVNIFNNVTNRIPFENRVRLAIDYKEDLQVF